MNDFNKVIIVDDDYAVRDSLSMLLEAAGYNSETFPSADSFLKACTPDMQGCLLLDVNMPGMDGLTLQEELVRRGILLPIVFLSGQGTIPATVRAMKAGALDFLTKPIDNSVLLGRVQEAFERCATLQNDAKVAQSIQNRLKTLTEREREVLSLAITGLSSKEIANQLSISSRTVEIHRANTMKKTGVSNLLELAHIFLPHESE